jgi:hypothetical protein
LQLLLEADKFRFVQSNIRIQDFLANFQILDEHIPYLTSVMDLDQHHIDMPAALASICNYAWNVFLSKAQRIHQSQVWSSFTKKIIDGYELDYHFVITDDHYSAYFKQYLLHFPGDAESLSCWRDIRHVLSTIQILKTKPPATETNSTIRRGPSNLSTNSSTLSRTMTTQSNLTTYPQPYEPLSILLECLRKYYSILLRGSCSAISKATKIRLSDLYQQTNSIRNIKTLDLNFAADCCESIETSLTILMGECYQYLQERYRQYFTSNEYVSAIASIRLRKSDIVQSYLRQNVFLREIADGKRFPRKLTGNLIFTNYNFSKTFYSSKISLLSNSFSSSCSSTSPCSNDSNSDSLERKETVTIVPFLVFRSDYSLVMDDLVSENYLSPILEETHCWIGESSSTLQDGKTTIDAPGVKCVSRHKIMYPENFTTSSATLISSNGDSLRQEKKKKKKVTFQIEEDDDSPNSLSPNGVAVNNSSSKPRPSDLTSLGLDLHPDCSHVVLSPPPFISLPSSPGPFSCRSSCHSTSRRMSEWEWEHIVLPSHSQQRSHRRESFDIRDESSCEASPLYLPSLRLIIHSSGNLPSLWRSLLPTSGESESEPLCDF